MSNKPVVGTPDVREALRKVVMSCFYLESGDCPVERNPACKQCDDWMDRIYSKVVQPLIEAAKKEGYKEGFKVGGANAADEIAVIKDVQDTEKLPKDVIAWLLRRLNNRDAADFMLWNNNNKALKGV